MTNHTDIHSKIADPKHIDNLKSPIPLRYEIFILLVSILSIVNIFLLFLPMYSQSAEVIEAVNLLLTIIFIGDFLYRIRKAKSKKFYLVHDGGWIDFLGSLPVSSARIFRMFRIIKSIKIIKKFGFKNMVAEINENRAQGALYIVCFLIILVLEFGAALVVSVESKNPNSNIVTGGDGLWWTFVTITTVGYGDRYPTTNAGRIIGAFVMVAGVGLFGVFTGFLANTFVTPKAKSDKPNKDDVKTQIKELKESLTKLEDSLDEK